MQRANSVMSTSPQAANTSIGTHAGAHGLSATEAEQVAVWLARQAPSEVDRAAVSRASSHSVELRVQYDHRFPKDSRGRDLPVVSVVVACDVVGTPEDCARAVADLRKFQTPAPQRAIEGWLAELSVICARRQDDEFADALRVEAYSSRLRQYPADVARAALLQRPWKFWPTWAELQEVCDQLAGPRRRMIDELERRIDRTPTDAPQTREPRVTAARAAEIMREFGFRMHHHTQSQED